MNRIPIVLVGNLTEEPELRFTQNGTAVCRFTVAHNPRRKVGDEWEDGEPTFMLCTAWRELAENIAESLHKGSRVIVAGALRTERWETDTGEKRSRTVCDVDAVGAELTWARVTIRRMARTKDMPPDDPWATASPEPPENWTGTKAKGEEQ